MDGYNADRLIKVLERIADALERSQSVTIPGTPNIYVGDTPPWPGMGPALPGRIWTSDSYEGPYGHGSQER